MTFLQLLDALQGPHFPATASAGRQSVPTSAYFLTHEAAAMRPRPAALSLLEPIPAANDNDPYFPDLHRSIG